jgi:PTH1 family peptidyl-tRNA hydrolase
MSQRVEATANCELQTANQSCEAIRLIVGLGNPGRQYEETRHNIGFAVVEALATDHDCKFSFSSKWNADIATVSSSLVLMKPMTFMNLSGAAVASYARFFKITAQEILVILDDVALPLGSLRLRRHGSAGGQRGLESVLTHFSTEEVPRMRIGVGPRSEVLEAADRPQMELSDFVLSRFHANELPHVKEAVQHAVDALNYLEREDLDKTMNFYNLTN